MLRRAILLPPPHRLHAFCLGLLWGLFFSGLALGETADETPSVSTLSPVPASAKEPPKPMQIFLLIGQSNMAGRAPLDELRGVAVASNAFLFATNRWEHAVPPFNRFAAHRKGLRMQLLNPGPSFVRAWQAAHPDARIGIVNEARGGTRIGQWEKGGKLHRAAVNAAKAGLKLAQAQPGGGEIAGILWHQGESNASNAEGYPEALAELVSALRETFEKPALPFVFGGLAEAKDSGRAEARRAFNAMLEKQVSKIPHSAFVSSEGLGTTDGIHFNRSAQLRLGLRYAAALERLVP